MKRIRFKLKEEKAGCDLRPRASFEMGTLDGEKTTKGGNQGLSSLCGERKKIGSGSGDHTVPSVYSLSKKHNYSLDDLYLHLLPMDRSTMQRKAISAIEKEKFSHREADAAVIMDKIAQSQSRLNALLPLGAPTHRSLPAADENRNGYALPNGPPWNDSGRTLRPGAPWARLAGINGQGPSGVGAEESRGGTVEVQSTARLWRGEDRSNGEERTSLGSRIQAFRMSLRTQRFQVATLSRSVNWAETGGQSLQQLAKQGCFRVNNSSSESFDDCSTEKDKHARGPESKQRRDMQSFRSLLRQGEHQQRSFGVEEGGGGEQQLTDEVVTRPPRRKGSPCEPRQSGKNSLKGVLANKEKGTGGKSHSVGWIEKKEKEVEAAKLSVCGTSVKKTGTKSKEGIEKSISIAIKFQRMKLIEGALSQWQSMCAARRASLKKAQVLLKWHTLIRSWRRWWRVVQRSKEERLA
ncbi:hypothetical protein CBR_g4401 [Chara braunii]|uniref:Uncharacterized protein n=1 Tax=Chara braunii TaxID=69332 RepID=A0A388KHT4_CHABU|nr:hypothetical protein CBR_g4401 [Chara braunii]|eukprot:GBG69567.1 hypothetical protein CBR_g4401 [Chara braunii]